MGGRVWTGTSGGIRIGTTGLVWTGIGGSAQIGIGGAFGLE